MLAVGAHLLRRGPRQQPALAARLARADALIIGIEAIFEALVEHAVAGEEGASARRPRRTRWYGRDAIWSGWRRHWPGRPGPRRSTARASSVERRRVSVRRSCKRGRFGLRSWGGRGRHRAVAHQPLSSGACPTKTPGSGRADASASPALNARFSSLFRGAEWLSMHNSVKRNLILAGVFPVSEHREGTTTVVAVRRAAIGGRRRAAARRLPGACGRSAMRSSPSLRSPMAGAPTWWRWQPAATSGSSRSNPA